MEMRREGESDIVIRVTVMREVAFETETVFLLFYNGRWCVMGRTIFSGKGAMWRGLFSTIMAVYCC